MRLNITAGVFLGLAALAASYSTGTKKAVVISYPQDTPDHILEAAKDAIRKLGGIITHEYNLIKGFAAVTSDQALESVQVAGKSSQVVIEEDKQFSISRSY